MVVLIWEILLLDCFMSGFKLKRYRSSIRMKELFGVWEKNTIMSDELTKMKMCRRRRYYIMIFWSAERNYFELLLLCKTKKERKIIAKVLQMSCNRLIMALRAKNNNDFWLCQLYCLNCEVKEVRYENFKCQRYVVARWILFS